MTESDELMATLFANLPPARRALAIDAHLKLHKLWTKSDGPNYVKAEWLALEKALDALACDTSGGDPKR